jgi:hypothetical protein
MSRAASDNPCASPAWSKPRHRCGTIMTSVPSWLVMKPSSLARQIGSTGFCTAPRRASATITTIVSSAVGNCHETMVPAPTPSATSAAAVVAAASRNRAVVRLRPKSSESTTRSGCIDAAESTRPQKV